MYLRPGLTLFLCLFSLLTIANEYNSPIGNISVFSTEDDNLAIENFSNEVVIINIHGNVIELPPTSGAQVNCAGYQQLELIFEHNVHDFFQVSCHSRVVISATFTHQYVEGK